jgi:tRNA threonylcarbamoyladenosine biosynthesis protein TsaB
VILALDTTSEYGSIAVARGAEILGVEEIHSTEGFGHLIFQGIVALLDRLGLKLRDIDCYAAANGPGSFTGVRVGLTAAKGLAEANGKRVVPVSNLLALACAGRGDLRAPLLDARRGEIYGAVYDAELRPVIPEVVTTFPLFLEMVGGLPVTFFSTGFEPAPGLNLVTVPRALAAPIARVAARVFAEGGALLPEEADANYVRRSDAELKWKE